MADAIDINELKKLIANSDRLSILDVRRKTDYEAAAKKVVGAKWYDPEKIDEWVKQLPAGNRTVVYCVKGGSISQSVTDRLRNDGIDAVFLEGGLKNWMENGQSVEASAASRNAYTMQNSDIGLLRKAGVSEEDIAHSVKVAEKALEIATRTNKELDLEFVGRGALFHDLGKAKTHDIEHGKIGAELGHELGLPQAITAVMEKHIRGGLTGPEAAELGLPVKDYTASRLEERIIIYADRLVDIITDGVVKEEPEAEARFEEILSGNPRYGKNEPTLRRYLAYHKEIQEHTKKQGA